MKYLLALLLALGASAQAATIYRCGSGDNIVFQDYPCGTERVDLGPAKSSASEPSAAAQEKQALTRVQAERRIVEIDRLVEEKEATIRRLDNETDQRLADLQTRTEAAYKEPFGARLANSLSQEAQAIVDNRASQTKALRREIEALKQERAGLASSASPTAPTEAKAALTRVQAERRVVEIDRLVDEKEAAIRRLNNETDQRLAELQLRTEAAYKEPFGARLANSLSKEAQAIGDNRASQTNAWRREIEALKKERATLVQ